MFEKYLCTISRFFDYFIMSITIIVIITFIHGNYLLGSNQGTKTLWEGR